MFTPFKGTIVNSSCILISRHDHIISFTSIFFNKITLIASTEVSVFFFNEMYASAQNATADVNPTISRHPGFLEPS
jgi:hypothetical protein